MPTTGSSSLNNIYKFFVAVETYDIDERIGEVGKVVLKWDPIKAAAEYVIFLVTNSSPLKGDS